MAPVPAGAGARVAVPGRRRAEGVEMALQADVRDRDAVACSRLMDQWGELHILINAAGGNLSDAIVPEGADVFAMSEPAFRDVVDLNLVGTLLADRALLQQPDGSLTERGEAIIRHNRPAGSASRKTLPPPLSGCADRVRASSTGPLCQSMDDSVPPAASEVTDPLIVLSIDEFGGLMQS